MEKLEMVDNLKFLLKINNVVVFDNTEMNTDENLDRLCAMQLENARNYAYKKRRGADNSFTIEQFDIEAEERNHFPIFINMAYTAILKATSKGVLSEEVGGLTTSYESGGLYTAEDLFNFQGRCGYGS